MSYQFRWVYALLVAVAVIAAGYIEMIAPKLNSLMKLNKTENEWTNKIDAIKNLKIAVSSGRVEKNVKSNEWNWLQEWIALVHFSGVSVETVKIIPLLSSQPSRNTLLHLVVHGNFSQINTLLSEMDGGYFSARVQDFVIKATSQDSLQLNMTVLLSVRTLSHLAERSRVGMPLQRLQNPFCLSGVMHHGVFRRDDVVLQQTPLALIKMTGFMQQGARKNALVLLPDQRLIAVRRFAKIGSEHGLVTAIQNDRILINLPTGKKQEIVLSP